MKQNINIADFYILNGVLLFIEAVGEKREYNSGRVKNGIKNAKN